jgi:hypothetical protein
MEPDAASEIEMAGKRWGDSNMPRLSLRQRLIVGAWLLFFLPVEANFLFDWGLLDPYDRPAAALAGVAGALLFYRIGLFPPRTR